MTDMTATASPDTRSAVQRVRRLICTVDLTFKGQDYRLIETARTAGASVRFAGEHTACLTCPRRFRPQTKCVCLPDGTGPLCLPCAISNGALIPVGKSTETPDLRTAEEALEGVRR